jgi:hypothetical protein
MYHLRILTVDKVSIKFLRHELNGVSWYKSEPPSKVVLSYAEFVVHSFDSGGT